MRTRLDITTVLDFHVQQGSATCLMGTYGEPCATINLFRGGFQAGWLGRKVAYGLRRHQNHQR